MKQSILRCLLAGFLLFLGAGTARADEDFQSARVSDLQGNLSVRGVDESDFSFVERNVVIREGDILWSDENGRAELELERGSWVRLAEDTKLEVRRLGSGAEFRLWTGSVFFDLSDRMEGPTRLKTPVGDVDVFPNSVVRVDLNRTESARVSVFSGKAGAVPDRGDALRVSAGERLYLEADRQLEDPRPFDREDRDGFDRYQRDRVDFFIERPLPRELDREIIGARELNDYGSWVTYENSTYWRPRCDSGWRPYSTGYWSYVPACGYNWVDYNPWGYTTSHYGRWLYRPAFGWLWAPGYAWAPSSVSWSTYGNYCGWAPLDPWDRPCFADGFGGNGFGYGFGGSSTFIDFRSWTFCDRDRFFLGRHHRSFDNGRRFLVTGNDIRAGSDGFRLIGDVHREIGVPRDSVRGITVGKDGAIARDRVLRLENRLPERRLHEIQNRFGVAPTRDRDQARLPGEVERLQKRPEIRIDDGQILKGADVSSRLFPGLRNRSGNGASGPGPGPGPGKSNGGIVPPPSRGDDRDRGNGAGTGVRPPASGDSPGRSRDRGGRDEEKQDRNGGSGRVQPPSAPSPTTPPDKEPRDRRERDNPFRRGIPSSRTDRRSEEPGRDTTQPGPASAPPAPTPAPAVTPPVPSRGSGQADRDNPFRRGAPYPGRTRDGDTPPVVPLPRPTPAPVERDRPSDRPSYRDFPRPGNSTPAPAPAPAPSGPDRSDRDSGFRRGGPDGGGRGPSRDPGSSPSPAPSSGGDRGSYRPYVPPSGGAGPRGGDSGPGRSSGPPPSNSGNSGNSGRGSNDSRGNSSGSSRSGSDPRGSSGGNIFRGAGRR
jgi:hypothetical protein